MTVGLLYDLQSRITTLIVPLGLGRRRTLQTVSELVCSLLQGHIPREPVLPEGLRMGFELLFR